MVGQSRPGKERPAPWLCEALCVQVEFRLGTARPLALSSSLQPQGRGADGLTQGSQRLLQMLMERPAVAECSPALLAL